MLNQVLLLLAMCAVLLHTSSSKVSHNNNIQRKCNNYLGDVAHGGACYSTNKNSVANILKENDTNFEDPEIKEWHFHVYWFQNNEDQKKSALRIRDELIEMVRQQKIVVVLNGITNEILPKVNVSNIPLFNEEPIGPHPVGSYEVWCPKEYLAVSFHLLLHESFSSLFTTALTLLFDASHSEPCLILCYAEVN